MSRAQAKALATIAMIGAGAGALSGCGSTPKLASPYSRLNGALDRARALAHAKASNLSRPDVTGVYARRDAAERLESLYRRYASCGRGTPRQTTSSPVLVDTKPHGYRLVSEVMTWPAVIGPGHASALAARGFACDARVIRAHYRGSTFRVRSIVVSPLVAPVADLKGSVGLRQTTTVESNGTEMRAYDDRLGFVSGRTEVVLSAFGSPAPPPASIERRVVSLLHRRVIEARHR